TTLDTAEWNNSTIIKGDVAEAVSQLRQREGMDITVHGSSKLVQYLAQHDLVDEYHFLVYPVVLGTGKRLFGEGTSINLALQETTTFPTGVVYLQYGRGQ